jgi:integrase
MRPSIKGGTERAKRKGKYKSRYPKPAPREKSKGKRKASNGLMAYAHRVLLARDVTPEYAAKVRYCCRAFVDWLGIEPDVADLTADMVNEFLEKLQESERRPDTVAGYRRALLLIWNEAFREGDCDTPPLRVRRIRTYRDPVEAFTHEEIEKVLLEAGAVDGHFRNGAKISELWKCLILSAYGTGLRRGDLLRVKRKDVGADGVCRVRQNKTGYPVIVRFPKDALALRDAMMVVDDRMIPWPFHANALPRQFRKLCQAAGVRSGQFRWLRRSAGSYADAEKFGNGSLLLGHRDRRMFVAHYECSDITRQEPVSPPAIGTA